MPSAHAVTFSLVSNARGQPMMYNTLSLPSSAVQASRLNLIAAPIDA